MTTSLYYIRKRPSVLRYFDNPSPNAVAYVTHPWLRARPALIRRLLRTIGVNLGTCTDDVGVVAVFSDVGNATKVCAAITRWEASAERRTKKGLRR